MSKETVSKMLLASLLALILVAPLLLEASSQFEQWVPYVPKSSQVEFAYRRENGISYMDVEIEFPSSGFNISDWGNPSFAGNNISVNAEMWRWTGIVIPVIITMSHTYNLGNLTLGEYFFVFKVWEFPVQNATFFAAIIVPDDYSTIQEAINNASEGDTIFVRNGTYYENVVVNKTVSLIGEDRSNTIVDGNGTGTIFYITQDGVNITGFTIQNSEPYYQPSAGIRLENYISNCYITENNIRNNSIGLLLILASNNSISRNNIINNTTFGVELESSRSNTIFGNNIANNAWTGIGLDEAEDNVIFHNNFVNNTRQVGIGTPREFTNIWDNGYPSGGNYWSDYNGTDFCYGPYQNETGSDGIGDTQYVIDSNNQDNYPLMYPYNLIPWDLTGSNMWVPDDKCDIRDVAIVALRFGALVGDSRYDRIADITGPTYLVPDLIIDIRDIALVAIHFGEIDP